MRTIEIMRAHRISQTSINYLFKFGIYRCFGIERFNAILWHEVTKKEIAYSGTHTYIYTRTMLLLLSAKCELASISR